MTNTDQMKRISGDVRRGAAEELPACRPAGTETQPVHQVPNDLNRGNPFRMEARRQDRLGVWHGSNTTASRLGPKAVKPEFQRAKSPPRAEQRLSQVKKQR